VEDLINFKVLQTYINGKLVAEKGKSFIAGVRPGQINQFACEEQKKEAFSVAHNGEKEIMVIEALEGQLITNKQSAKPLIIEGEIRSDLANDILKIVVVNRYKTAPIAKAFVKNFGLKQGAIASSVAHDSHNIIAVGVDDASICEA
jgi:adenine deaminase